MSSLSLRSSHTLIRPCPIHRHPKHFLKRCLHSSPLSLLCLDRRKLSSNECFSQRPFLSSLLPLSLPLFLSNLDQRGGTRSLFLSNSPCFPSLRVNCNGRLLPVGFEAVPNERKFSVRGSFLASSGASASSAKWDISFALSAATGRGSWGTGEFCPGCGIKMQEKDSNSPGFFMRPKEKCTSLPATELVELSELNDDFLRVDDEGGEEGVEKEKRMEGWVEVDLKTGERIVGIVPESESTGFEDFDDDDFNPELYGIIDDLDELWNSDEEEEEEGKGKFAVGEKRSERVRGGKDAEGGEEESKEPIVVCARCHALRHYGKVKNSEIETLLPSFDFERVLGERLREAITLPFSPAGERERGRKRGAKEKVRSARPISALLLVIDISDFDGSFPREAARLIREVWEDAERVEREKGEVGAGVRRREQRIPASFTPSPPALSSPSPALCFPRIFLVANKVDLLPKHVVSLSRLSQWVRKRAAAGGLSFPPSLSPLSPSLSVHLVSSASGRGIAELKEEIEGGKKRAVLGWREEEERESWETGRDRQGRSASPRSSHSLPVGDVWVIGAQNAGKSSLINALSRETGRTGEGEGRATEGKKRGWEKQGEVVVTEAPLPGTTIGVIPIKGVLNKNVSLRLFDTPGLIHPHQINVRMRENEREMLRMAKRKGLKPRTFRAKVGYSIHIAGLARVDVLGLRSKAQEKGERRRDGRGETERRRGAERGREEEASEGGSVYLTVWAPPLLTCHLGKTENAEAVFEKHAGKALSPPLLQETVPSTSHTRLNANMRPEDEGGEENGSPAPTISSSTPLGTSSSLPVSTSTPSSSPSPPLTSLLLQQRLGAWRGSRSFSLSGSSWRESERDVCISGLGWVAVAVKGEVDLRVWTYEGVGVTHREAMLLDLAERWEKVGFTYLTGSR